MSKKVKFDKLGKNDSYYDTHVEESTKEDVKKKGIFSDMTPENIPEKKKAPSRFTYTKEQRKTIYNEEEQTEVENPKHAPYVLVFAVLILTVIAGLVASSDVFSSLTYKNAGIGKMLLMAVIYIVPSVVYIISSPSRMRLYNIRRFPASMLPITLVTLGLVTSLTFLQTYYITYTFSYNVSVATAPGNMLFAILTGAVMPALCEELFVRGIVQYEMSKYAGGITGIVAGALVFAIIHLDVQYFTVYLVSGIVLGALTHITHSVFPAMLVHFLNNTLSILFADKLSYIAIRRISGTLFMIILAALSFVFLIAMLKYAESMSLKRAAAQKPDPETENDHDGQEKLYKKPTVIDEARLFFSPSGNTAAKMGKVLSSPFMLASYAVFVIVAVIKFAL